MKTKYDINDSVYLMFSNRVAMATIEQIHIYEKGTRYDIKVHNKEQTAMMGMEEAKLFSSKEELIQTL